MGFFYRDKCYSTQALADDAFYSSQSIQSSSNATQSTVDFYYKTGAQWRLLHRNYSVTSGALQSSWSVALPSQTYPSCNVASTDYFLDFTTPQDVLATAVLLFAFILGFGQGKANRV
jgi:hypothetical protein